MRYTAGLVMLLLAVAVIWWALRHRRRVLALISLDALTRYREAQADDPKSISAFGEIVRPIVLFALVWIGVKSVAAYFWFDGFDFEQAVEAYQYLESGSHVGKVVIRHG